MIKNSLRARVAIKALIGVVDAAETLGGGVTTGSIGPVLIH